MALPTDSSETFLREVDENLRRDRMRDMGKRYGGWAIAALGLFLVAIGGYLYSQQRQQAEAARHSEELSQVYRDIGQGNVQTAPQRLDKIAAEGGDVARASALFTRAALALENNDRATALAQYRAISADDGLPAPYRDLALIRATTVEFDSLKPEEVIARMQPLAKAGEPWFGSAGELTSMALLRQGKNAEAGRLFAAIAADPQVPGSIRSRAVQIAGTLGVDATASLPAMAQ